MRAALVARSWRPRLGARPAWMADFLGEPPLPGVTTFAAALDHLAARWDDDAIRAALGEVGGGTLPAVLQRPGLNAELLGLLRWVWGTTVEADWPRRERVLHAGVVSRTVRLASNGWADVIGGLGTRRAWCGDGRLQVNGYDLPERARARPLIVGHLGGAQPLRARPPGNRRAGGARQFRGRPRPAGGGQPGRPAGCPGRSGEHHGPRSPDRAAARVGRQPSARAAGRRVRAASPVRA